jgi:hypothetical protein
MAVTIPTFDIASYSEELTLDEAQFRFALRYNKRGDFWVLDIADREGNMVIAGIKVVMAYELIRQYHYAAIPPGALATVDTAEPEARIGRDDLPDRVDLVYLTEAEYAAL